MPVWPFVLKLKAGQLARLNTRIETPTLEHGNSHEKAQNHQHISLDGVIQHSADDGDFPYAD